MHDLIRTDPDWISSKRYGYSATTLLQRHPDGVPVRIIAAVLLMSEDEVEAKYQEIVVKLRGLMGIEEE